MAFKALLLTLLLSEPFGGGSIADRHLQVAVFHNPPWTFVGKEGDSWKIYGANVELLNWLSADFNFTFTFVPVSLETEPNELKIITEFAARNDLDVLVPHVLFTYSRFRLVDFTIRTGTLPSAFLRPAVPIQNFLWGPVQPFTLTVWVLIVVSGVSVAVAMFLSRCKGIQRSSFSIQPEGLYVLSVITGQGEFRLPSSDRWNWAFRLSAGVWCLGAVVFFNVYNSTLVSHMTKPKLEEFPQWSNEIFDKGRLIYLVNKGGFGQEIIMNATSGYLKKMGDIFRKHPEYLVNNRAEAYNYVASGCCTYIDLLPNIQARAYRDYKETGRCRFSLGRVQEDYGIMALALKKHSPLAAHFNLGILRVQESGLDKFWSRRYSYDKMPCLTKMEPAPEKRTLNLNDMRFVFILLGAGYLIGLILFAMEKMAIRLLTNL